MCIGYTETKTFKNLFGFLPIEQTHKTYPCWFSVGSASQTVDQHWTSTGSVSWAYLEACHTISSDIYIYIYREREREREREWERERKRPSSMSACLALCRSFQNVPAHCSLQKSLAFAYQLKQEWLLKFFRVNWEAGYTILNVISSLNSLIIQQIFSLSRAVNYTAFISG